MRHHERAILIFGLAFAGAGAIAYWRGQRGRDLVIDTLAHGAVVGTAVNVIAWLAALNDPRRKIEAQSTPSLFGGAVALANGATAMGNMSKDAIRLLSKVDAEKLYRPMNKNGVKVGPTPVDEHIIE